jgi:hypothetical protein
MARQLAAVSERADNQQERADTQHERTEIQQERIDLAARELAEVRFLGTVPAHAVGGKSCVRPSLLRAAQTEARSASAAACSRSHRPHRDIRHARCCRTRRLRNDRVVVRLRVSQRAGCTEAAAVRGLARRRKLGGRPLPHRAPRLERSDVADAAEVSRVGQSLAESAANGGKTVGTRDQVRRSGAPPPRNRPSHGSP